MQLLCALLWYWVRHSLLIPIWAWLRAIRTTLATYGVDEDGEGKEVPLNTVLTFTYDIDALKKAASGDINVNFYNGFEIVKAVIRTADEGGAAKTADTTTVVLFGAVAVVALVAVVASKKARA